MKCQVCNKRVPLEPLTIGNLRFCSIFCATEYAESVRLWLDNDWARVRNIIESTKRKLQHMR